MNRSAAIFVLVSMVASLARATPGAIRPDRVFLRGAESVRRDDGERLLWQTGLEWRLLSFDLWRRTSNVWTKVNTSPIPAANAFSGAVYETPVPDDGGAKVSYRWMVRLDSGEMLELGPLSVDPASWFQPTPAVRSGDVPGTFSEPRPAGGITPVDLTSGDGAVKLRTSAAGIHFVSAASLGAVLNQPAPTVAAWLATGAVAMSSGGRPVVFIPGNGWTGPGQTGPGLYFYAEIHRDNYTYENVYWIRAGSNVWSAADGGNPAPVALTGGYRAIVNQEVDHLLVSTLAFDPEQDFWMWAGLAAGNTNFDHWSTSVATDHLAAEPGAPPILTLRLFGGSQLPHEVQATLNGVTIGTVRWAGESNMVASLAVPPGLLLDGALGQGRNTLTLLGLLAPDLPPGVDADQTYLNGFSLAYDRAYQAALGSIEGGVDSRPVITVSGFTGSTAPPIAAFDVANPRAPILITNLATTADAAGWRVTFSPPDPAGRIAAVQSNLRGSTPALAEPPEIVHPAHLSDATNRAAYVIITVPALADGAAQWAAYRTGFSRRIGAGLRSKVVMVDDIFNEFSDGRVTPRALADFLRTACRQWSVRPRFVCLVGNGSIDFRNLLGYGDNMVPPLMVGTAYGLFSSDSLLGDVDGSGRPKVAIGRLPVRNPSELAAVLAKIESYESALPAAPLEAVFLADQPDAAGDFIANIGAMASELGPRFNSVQIHPPRAPAPVDAAALQGALQAALNRGADLVNYFGHGAVDRFGNGAAPYWVASQSTPPLLTPAATNASRLPLVLAMTCVAGQYSSPGYTCLGKGLLLAPGTGAAGVIAPTGLSLDNEAFWINRRLVELLNLSRGGRIGELMVQSFSLYDAGGPWVTPVWIYNLIGDPAMELALP
jgi:Peptidase family C25